MTAEAAQACRVHHRAPCRGRERPRRECGLPVGINGTADIEQRYAQGVCMFVSIGVGARPPTSEQRRAVGRQGCARM